MSFQKVKLYVNSIYKHTGINPTSPQKAGTIQPKKTYQCNKLSWMKKQLICPGQLSGRAPA